MAGRTASQPQIDRLQKRVRACVFIDNEETSDMDIPAMNKSTRKGNDLMNIQKSSSASWICDTFVQISFIKTEVATKNGVLNSKSMQFYLNVRCLKDISLFQLQV